MRTLLRSAHIAGIVSAVERARGVVAAHYAGNVFLLPHNRDRQVHHFRLREREVGHHAQGSAGERRRTAI